MIHYDEEIIRRARNIDMIDFLSRRLNTWFRHTGGEFRSYDFNSLVVKNDRLKWYWNSKGEGGLGAIDYLLRIDKMGFRDAMQELTTYYADLFDDDAEIVEEAKRTAGRVSPEEKPTSPFLFLPDQSPDNRRAWAYLVKTRHIHCEIVESLIDQGMIYQSMDGNISNVVFLGFDEFGEVRYASLRGTLSNSKKSFRHDASGSDKRYSFRFGDDSGDAVYVFEAAIDAMSHATLALHDGNRWWEQSRLSLGGTADTALSEYLRTHPHTKRIILCTDNDEAGNTAAEQMVEKYQGLGYDVKRERPECKDFNEDLCVLVR